MCSYQNAVPRSCVVTPFPLFLIWKLPLLKVQYQALGTNKGEVTSSLVVPVCDWLFFSYGSLPFQPTGWCRLDLTQAASTWLFPLEQKLLFCLQERKVRVRGTQDINLKCFHPQILKQLNERLQAA